jgi:uncharacterized protein YggE
MKIRIAVALMLLTCAGLTQAQTSGPFIAVHGRAQQEVVPDIFPVELTLRETSKDAAATQARIESLAKNILATLESMKVEDGDINVSNLSISPEYTYDDKTDKQVFLGNTYERTIKVRFHSLQKLQEFISSLPQSNVLHLETTAFATSKSAELRRELLDKAIADAKATAEAMATGVGRKLGAVQNISNQGLNVRYSESAGLLDKVTVTGTRVANPQVVLREGKITLDQDVYIVYSLE